MAQASENILLLDNVIVTGSGFKVKGGLYLWSLVATDLDGETATLQFLGPDGSTWVDVDGAALTANGATSVLVANGANIRVSLSGGGGTIVGVTSALTTARE